LSNRHSKVFMYTVQLVLGHVNQAVKTLRTFL